MSNRNGRNPTKRRLTFASALLFTAGVGSPACLATEPPVSKPANTSSEVAAPSPEQIQTWIKQLGDNDFQKRESAQEELVNAGNSAYFALEALPPSDDPEVRARIERTLTALEDDAVEQLRKLKARVLKRDGAQHWNHFAIENPEARDEDLAPLLRLKHLEHVGFEATPVTDKVLDYCQHLTNLRYFSAYHTNISDAGLEKLSRCWNLEGMGLLLPKMTNKGMMVLATLPKLRQLTIFDSPIDGNGLVHLRPLKDQIEVLQLEGTLVSDEDLIHLRDFNVLRALRLNRTKLTGTGLRHIRDLPKLKWMSLGGTELTDDAFPHIAKMPVLERLVLHGVSVSPDSLLLLRESTSLVSIQLFAEDFTKDEADAIQKAFDARGVESKVRIHRS
jgi:hypothetical protein